MKKIVVVSALAFAALPLLLMFSFGVGFLGLSAGAPSGGREIAIPEEYGNGGFTITCYDDFYGRWAEGTGQAEVYERWVAAGAEYEDGIAVMDGRYLLACTEKFGRCGDEVTFKLEDGTAIPGIIADIKSSADPGCNEWGHNNGQNIIEFEVLRSRFVESGNPGSDAWHPEWAGKRVSSCIIAGESGSALGCATLGAGNAEGYLALAIQIAEDDSHGYTLGATGPDEFDCQGLVKYVLSQNGYDSSKWGYASDGSGTGAAAEGLVAMGFTEFEYGEEGDLRPGDILLYHYAGTGTGHVAIYVGNGQIVEAIGDKDGMPGDGDGTEIRVTSNWADGLWQTYYRDLASKTEEGTEEAQ